MTRRGEAVLVVEYDERITCGAALGRDTNVTVLVLHPYLTAERRQQLAAELLNEQEMTEWQEQHVAL